MLIRTRPHRPMLPLNAFGSFDRSFDRAFEQLASSFFSTAKRTPVVDAAWHEGDLVLTVDLPGVPADHVDVSVSGRILTLSAKTDDSTWERSLTLGSALDPEHVTATYADGRLTVTVGAAAREIRRIEISTTPAAAIEAGEPAEQASEAQPENGTSENG